MTDANKDAIADANRWLADAVIDGGDVNSWAELVTESPMVAALVADMLLHNLRLSMDEDERVLFAQALRFSCIASLADK